MRPTGRPSRRAGRGRSPCTRLCAPSAVRAWPSSSTAAATSRSASRRRSPSFPAASVLNEVVLNQVLFRFEADAATRSRARRRAAERRGVDGRYDVAGSRGDPRLRLELEDDGGGYRPHRRRLRGGARTSLTRPPTNAPSVPAVFTVPGTVKAPIVRRSLHTRRGACGSGLPSRHGASTSLEPSRRVLHVFSRGVAGASHIFEDADDRDLFVELVWRAADRHS